MIIDKHYKYCYYERGADNGVTVLAKKVCQSSTLHKSCGGTRLSPTYSTQYAPKEEEAGVGPGKTAETPTMKQAKKRSRVKDEDAEMELSPQVEPQELGTPGHDRPSTPVDDVHVRRKRIRW